jgi:hypothetical protein
MRSAVLAIVIAGLGAPPAEACTCRLPALEVSPKGTGVPLNATVMIWVQERYARDSKPKFALRTGRKQIPFTSKVTGSGKTEVFELVPKAPLVANTTYEVVVEQAGKQTVAQTFTTGTAKATQPPAWKAQGIGRVRYFTPEMSGGGSCMNGTPNLEVYWMSDDPQPAKLRIGVWIGTTIDFSKPPTTYVDGLRIRQVLGDPTYCSSSTLTIPVHEKLQFAAKLFDVAGNASDERTFTVDTTKAVVEREYP